MSALKSWSEVHEAKRGAAELLARAAAAMQNPGADPDEIWTAMADARVAALTLAATANAAEVLRAAAMRQPDVHLLRAGEGRRWA